MMNAVV
jgi:hypothetical protein